MEEERPHDAPPKSEVPPSANNDAPPGHPVLLNEGLRAVNQAFAGVPPQPEEYAEEPAMDAPIIRMANAILSTGIDSRASAIHCEPDRRILRVRVRIDGVMTELMTIPKHVEPPLLRRYMIMAELNPFARHSQVGYIPVKHNTLDYTIRVSALPSLYGTSLVLKIYNESMGINLGVNKLGMMPGVQQQTEYLLTRPGLFLIAGPADSGRTTTAYRFLQKLNILQNNTLSVEDMPGYRLSGITQVYSQRLRDVSHAEAIASARNLLPDVLFVGDITRREAAEEAVSAAESGVTVIGVIGAMDSVGGILALMRLGISPDRIAGAVSGILSQQLVRLPCKHCRAYSDVPVPGNLRDSLTDFWKEKPETFIHAAGCDNCMQRGYWDRLGIFELFPMTSALQDTLSGMVTNARLRDAARLSGMQTLASVAWEWAAAGMISRDEAQRVEASLPPV